MLETRSSVSVLNDFPKSRYAFQRDVLVLNIRRLLTPSILVYGLIGAFIYTMAYHLHMGVAVHIQKVALDEPVRTILI